MKLTTLLLCVYKFCSPTSLFIYIYICVCVCVYVCVCVCVFVCVCVCVCLCMAVCLACMRLCVIPTDGRLESKAPSLNEIRCNCSDGHVKVLEVNATHCKTVIFSVACAAVAQHAGARTRNFSGILMIFLVRFLTSFCWLGS